MSGFTGSTTALRIFNVQLNNPDGQRLYQHVFTPTPGPDGKRIGWVGLGDPLDLEFAVGIDHGRFLAWSLRIDERKPSSAAIRIRLAEALKKEAEKGKVSRTRKKELKESITAAVTAKTEFIPTLTDCILDVEAQKLYVSSTSGTILNILLELFKQTFEVSPTPVTASADMGAFFAKLFKEDVPLKDGIELRANGCAVTLSTPQQSENQAQVSVVNNEAAVDTALKDGLHIVKMAIVAVDGENELSFAMSDDLMVTGLKLPKGERDDDPEATFLLKADACATVARIIKTFSR